MLRLSSIALLEYSLRFNILHWLLLLGRRTGLHRGARPRPSAVGRALGWRSAAVHEHLTRGTTLRSQPPGFGGTGGEEAKAARCARAATEHLRASLRPRNARRCDFEVPFARASPISALRAGGHGKRQKRVLRRQVNLLYELNHGIKLDDTSAHGMLFATFVWDWQQQSMPF